MGRFQLVIFDCDGVLVDSERITNRVFADMLNELGLAVTLEFMFERFVGNSFARCLDLVAQMLGRPPPPDFADQFHRRTRAALVAEVAPVPGIVSALDHVGLPYCVASSGEHEKMRATLGAAGLLHRLEGKLYSVTEVARGKPAPDIFIHAAKRMGVPPSACAVVEDTPTGVAAGVAAGMTVFGYAALIPADRLLAAGALCTFDDMNRLPALLAGTSASVVR
jgi:HAD superfamily hydrolase (TIGR01509 family)